MLEFPASRPQGACFPRPFPNQSLNLTPPGFCWWRASEPGEARYQLRVQQGGSEVYVSPLLDDPVHVPAEILPPGDYTWTVAAVNGAGGVADRTGERTFTIEEDAGEQPWVEPAELLARVPRERPRALFLAADLEAVRATLTTTRAEAFAVLKQEADESVQLEPPPEPDYDRIQDRMQRRLAYQDCFRDMRRYHDTGMRSLALMYVLTGEKKYGEAARKLIVAAAGWDPEGISSVLSPYGDEVGLGLGRVGAEVFDWIYDLFTDAEREKVRNMVRARADQMLRRLRKRDFLYKPEESHAGRLPGFLLEHAVVLAEDDRAPVWVDYALRAARTVHPHWAGEEGGWAQGVPYGMAYNTIHLMPYDAWTKATEFDLWQGPFHIRMPWFFLYTVSPVGETMPFGDTEHSPVRPAQARTLIHYHALLRQDSRLKAWADLVKKHAGPGASLNAFPGILSDDSLPPGDLSALPPDRAFRGVGWAALHSDLAHPERDLMVSFRSSPYGGVSHGHASQNDFAVQKGGRALICAGGLRFPQHGTPFHKEYAQQSWSHNCVLVNGEGQIYGDGRYNGHIAAFRTEGRFGYVCGDATPAYGGRLTRCVRHLLLLRPAVILLVDELAADEPAAFQWLLHAFERFALDESGQTVTSSRKGAVLTARLFSQTSLGLWQTDAWPVAPDKGYTKLERPMPEKRWHFSASTERVQACRIAAVMTVRADGEPEPQVEVTPRHSGLEVKEGESRARIDLGKGEALSFG